MTARVLRAGLAFALMSLATSALSTITACRRASAPPPIPTKKWQFTTGKPDLRIVAFSPSPAVGDDGTIYAGATRGVFALKPDGSKKWFHQAVYEAAGNTVIFVVLDDSGNIWYDETGTVTGGVIRLAPDGSGGNDGISRAAVTQIGVGFAGTVFMGTQQAMVAIDHTQSVAQEKWTRLGTAFALAPDNSVFSIVGSNLAHYDAKGDLKWVDPLLPGCSAPVLGDDNTIYVGCYEKVVAINADSTPKWSLALRGRSGTPSIAQDGTLYLACHDRSVCAVSSDGHLKWEFETFGAVHSVPAITRNGAIYFGSADRNLYSVGADGKKRWEFQTQGEVYSPSIAGDGTIYVQSSDGNLYAIQDSVPNGGLLGQWPKYGGGLRNTTRGGSLPVK